MYGWCGRNGKIWVLQNGNQIASDWCTLSKTARSYVCEMDVKDVQMMQRKFYAPVLCTSNFRMMFLSFFLLHFYEFEMACRIANEAIGMPLDVWLVRYQDIS